MNIPAAWDAVADFWTTHSQPIILAAGGVAIALGAFLAWCWYKRGAAHQRTGTLAVAVATAFTAEGMWEVAREALGLPTPTALILFAMFEIVMVNQAQTARYKLTLKPPGNARKHMTFVWLLAGASGIVASLNSDNVVEFVLRLTAPFVAAGIWWMALTADGVVKNPDPISWRITPRRVLVFLRIADPGERDVIEVDRDRQVAKVADLSYRLFRGIEDPKAQAKVERKLSDLLLTVDRKVVERASAQVWQAIAGRRLTVPSQGAVEALEGAASGVPEWEITLPPEHLTATSAEPRNPSTGTPGGTPANGSATPLADTLTKGSGTPGRNPSGTPVEPRRASGSVKGAGTPVTSGGTPAGTPRQNPSRDGVDTPDEYPADGVLLPVLRNPAKVSRDPDGTVPVKRAMRVLSIGRPRAIRLLTAEGLLPGTGAGTPDAKGADTPGGTPTAEGSDDDQERHPEPLKTHNGAPQPELIGALS